MSGYTLAELSRETGLPPRTIRYYISQGLVPGPGREGRSTRYPASTLARLRLIVRWRDEDLPIARIRQRLDRLDRLGPPMSAAVADDLVMTRRLEAPTLASEAWPAASDAIDVDRLAEPPRVQYLLAAPAPVERHVDAEQLRVDAAWDELGDPEALLAEGPPEPRLGARSQWEHIGITQDVELHVRRPLGSRDTRVVDRLMALARELLEEE